MLHKKVGCIVMVENDINLAALGERYRGASRNESDFAYISIGKNVGAGIVLNSKIHHGAQWSAGEIAYLRLPNTSRKQLTVFEFGELESVLTSSGIIASWREQTGEGSSAISSALQVLDLAEAGDALAKGIVQYRSGIVADIVLNLCLILNPALILLGGTIGEHPALLRGVQEQLEGSEFGVTRVLAGVLGDAAVLWGAVMLALDLVPEVILPPAPL
jgi:glucokinase